MKASFVPKIALFYDWLNQWGGAEKLLLDILKVFPDAQVFTSIHDPKQTIWLPQNTKISTSFMDNFSIFKHNSPLSALVQPIALEQFKFDDFNIVISLTSLQGKCLLTPPSVLYICYCLTPNRYLYQKNNSWFNFYKNIDRIYSQRPDNYLAISKTVQKRITKHYHRSSTIVYPGVDLKLFKPPTNTFYHLSSTSYFLIVSRLVPHKKIDIAIRACLETNSKLKIIGDGREMNNLKKLAQNSPLIEFLGSVDQKTLLSHYQQCLALIHPQNEDFGYTAIEAQACGKPVIAFRGGGAKETIIDGKTGLFFDEQTITSLAQTIKIFPKNIFLSSDCRQNASRFSSSNFMLDFKKAVQKLWRHYPYRTTI